VTDFSPTVLVDEDSGGTYVAGTEGTTLVTDRITSCSLYDGTTLVSGPESIASATAVTGGKINFADFSYSIAAGTTATLSVHCNLANVNPGTADLFAIASAATGDITALDTEGDSATVTGTANTTPSMAISVVNAGTLTVTAASDAPSADFLLTGSSENTVSKFRFDAASEGFVVDRLTVEEQQAATDTGTANSSSYANNVSLVTLSYPDSTGTTQTATGALTSNALTLNGLTFYVGKDTHAEVTVKIDVPSTDRSSGSATSNERVRMVLDDDTGEARAVGASSGTTLSATNDIVGISVGDGPDTSMAKFVIRETKPTIALSSSSPSGAKTPGNQETLRFNVTAAAGEDVILKNLVFSFSASDNAASSWDNCDTDVTSGAEILASGADFHIYNMNKLGTATALDAANDFTILTATGTPCNSTDADVAFVKLSLTTEEVIPAGTTYAYALYFNSDSASSVNDDSVQIGIASDPIATTYLAFETAAQASGAHTATVTTLTANVDMDASIDATNNSNLKVGDIVVAGSSAERMLVTAYAGSTTATVLRGYLGTTPAAFSDTDALTRLPGAMLWQDDGSVAVSSSNQEYYGAHLVDSLPITGSSISF